MYCSIKSAIIADESNRNKYYFIKMQNLINQLPPDHQDRLDLFDLMEESLRKQHRMHLLLQKKDIFHEKSVNQYMRSLRPVKPIFYDFTFPDDVQRRAKWIKAQRDLSKQEVTSTMDIDYRTAILNRSHDLIHDMKVESKEDFWNLVTALQIVSGRRVNEIAINLEYDSIPDKPFQALVTGISKKFNNDEVYTIPLLVSYTKFKRAMDKIRDYDYHEGMKFCDHANKQGELDKASQKREKMFGLRVIHSEIRAIYAEEAYKERAYNKFEEKASMALFKSRALSLPDPSFSPLAAYTRINFTSA